MPYLICDKCEVFYEIDSKGDDITYNFCDCGNKLSLYNSLEEYYHKKGRIKKPINLFKNLVASYESSITRIIMYCVEESPSSELFDIVGILQGSNFDISENNQLNTLLSYSTLSNFSQIYLNGVINRLIDESFLKIKDLGVKKLYLTTKGRNFLHNNDVVGFNFIEENSGDKFIAPNESLDLQKILIEDKDGSKRAHVAYILGESKDPKYVNVLCEATKDKDGNVRRLSASALGKIGDIRATDALIKLLKDPKPQVRQYAVHSLGKLKSKKPIDQLKQMMNDDSPYVVQEVEKILSKSENDSKVSKDYLDFSELSQILLNHVDNKKRARAAYLLGETKDNSFLDVLCKATSDQNANVRRLSASALGKIGDIRAADALIKLLKDPKPQVRQYAVKALGRIGVRKEESKKLTITEPKEVVTQVISKESTPKEEDKKLEDVVHILLNDRKENNRAQAAYNLGRKKDSKYVDALCKATQDESANVRRLSIVALGKIGDERAEDTFIRLLNDPDPYTRQYAIIGLGKINSKKAVPNLKILYNDPVSYVRNTAFETVSKLN